MEAAKPKIAIDFSGLEQIRRDAAFTRDSLLTEEEEDWAERRPEEQGGPADGSAAEPKLPGLDGLHTRILLDLLEGKSPDCLLYTSSDYLRHYDAGNGRL